MAPLFTGCSSFVHSQDEKLEFQVDAPAPSRLENRINRNLNTSCLGNTFVDTHRIGKVFTSAVSGIGEHVKSAGTAVFHHASEFAEMTLPNRNQFDLNQMITDFGRQWNPVTSHGGNMEFSYASTVSDPENASHSGFNSNNIRVWGDGNFELVLEQESNQFEASGQFKAYTFIYSQNFDDTKPRKIPLDCLFTWQRVLPHGVCVDVQVPDAVYSKNTEDNCYRDSENKLIYSRDTYQISAEDIGCVIQVKCRPINSSGPQFSGQDSKRLYTGFKYASVGPFHADSSLTRIIYNAFSQKSIRYNCLVDLSNDLMQNLISQVIVSKESSIKADSGQLFSLESQIHPYSSSFNDSCMNSKQQPNDLNAPQANLHILEKECIISIQIPHHNNNNQPSFSNNTHSNANNNAANTCVHQRNCRYTHEYPSVEIDPQDDVTFVLKVAAASSENSPSSLASSGFSSTNHDTFILRAFSRRQRDAIIACIRAFQARITTETFFIINNNFDHLRVLQKVRQEKGLYDNNSSNEFSIFDNPIDFCNILSTLLSQVTKMQSNETRVLKDKERLIYEKAALEEEMKDTICAFQSQIDALAFDRLNLENAQTTIENKAESNQREEELEAIKLLVNEQEKQLKVNQEIINKQKLHIQTQDERILNLEDLVSSHENDENLADIESFKYELNRLKNEVQNAHLEKHMAELKLSEASRESEIQIEELKLELCRAKEELNSTKQNTATLVNQTEELRKELRSVDQIASGRVRAVEQTLASETAFKENLEATVKELQTSLDQNICERNRLLKQIESMQKDVEKNSNVAKNATQNIQKVLDEKRIATESLASLSNQFQQQNQILENLKSTNEALNQKHNDLIIQLEQLAAKNTLLEQNEAKQKQTQSLQYQQQQQIQFQLKDQIKALEMELRKERDRCKNIQDQYIYAQKHLQEKTNEALVISGEANSLKAALTAAQEREGTYQESISQYERNICSKDQHINELAGSVHTLKARLDSTLSELQNVQGDNTSLRTRLKKLVKSKSGETPGNLLPGDSNNGKNELLSQSSSTCLISKDHNHINKDEIAQMDSSDSKRDNVKNGSNCEANTVQGSHIQDSQEDDHLNADKYGFINPNIDGVINCDVDDENDGKYAQTNYSKDSLLKHKETQIINKQKIKLEKSSIILANESDSSFCNKDIIEQNVCTVIETCTNVSTQYTEIASSPNLDEIADKNVDDIEIIM